MPHLDTMIAKTLGPKNPNMPTFIAINQTVEETGKIATLKTFHTTSFLESKHEPFLIVDPQNTTSAMQPPKKLSNARFRSRHELFEKLLDQEPMYQYNENFQRESLIKSLDTADQLLKSPSTKTFNLSLKPKKTFDTYNTNHFGQNYLLAHHLIETNTHFIEITSKYIPFLY